MTQKEFARRMGKTESEVSVWLSGQHNFTLRTLARISAVLGEDVVSVT
ncbi:MAG: helix-turn-helix transcriptional regulator [Prevotella sp.]|nr:helix-turn-helix transcriptional regulator [Prevotella sp.]